MAKILIFDIETIGMPNGLKADVSWTICIGYKWYGEKETHALKLSDYAGWEKNPTSDKAMLKEFYEIYKSADLVVAHYGALFDRRFLEGRLIINDLPPLPDTKLMDTCLIARSKFAFRSNSLKNLAIAFGCSELKGESDFPYDWIKVLQGGATGKRALAKITEYCKQDVRTLEAIYDKMRARMTSHPHVGKIEGKAAPCSCRVCGSSKLKKNGIRITAGGAKRQELQCRDCGAYQRVVIYESKDEKFGTAPKATETGSKTVLRKT